MYNGIKRKQQFKINFKMPQKAQIITLEETETNGIIRQNYVIKTKEYIADQNISYTDFEIANLLAAGVNVKGLQTVTMAPDRDKLQQNATIANLMCDQLQEIQEYERQIEQQNTAAAATEQAAATQAAQ